MKLFTLFFLCVVVSLSAFTQPCTDPDVPQIGYSDTLICAGESVALSITSGNLNDASYWAWRSDSCDGALVSTDPTIYVTPTQTTTYFVKGEGGCTHQTICAEITIHVTPAPNPQMYGNDSICPGQTAELYFYTGPYTFLWFDNTTDTLVSVSPSSTTNYYVNITDTNTTCSNLKSFQVFVYTSPNVVIMGEDIICAGASDTLYASGFASYSWSNGGTDSFIVVNPTSTHIYSLLVVDTNGCSGFDLFSLSVLPIPNADIFGDSVICFGESTNLIAEVANEYEWSTGETSQSITVAPTHLSTYSVTLTNSDGCIAEASVQVSVLDLPAVTTTPDTTLCLPDSILLLATGGGEYLWNTGETTNSIEVSPTTATTYSVIVTNINTQCSSYDTVFVDVASKPIVSIASSDSIYCSHESILLVASGADTYLWSTAQTGDTTYVQASMGSSFYVTGTDTNGCFNSDTIEFQYIPAPELSFIGDSSICRGENTTISVLGADDYIWYNNSNDSFITVHPDTTRYLTIVGIDVITGCETPDSILVFVSQGPTMVFSGDDTICGGHMAEILVSGAVSVLWSTGATDETINISPDSSLWLYVDGIDTMSCSGRDSLLLVVNPSPDATIFLVHDTLCTLDPNMGLTAWPGGGSFSGTGVFGSTFLPAVAGPGFHSVFYNITNEFGCHDVDTAVVLVESCVGIEELSEVMPFVIYPNPGNGVVFIDFKSTELAIYQVFNLQGGSVHQGRLNTGIHEVNLENLSDGYYLIEVNTGKALFRVPYVLTR